MFKDVFSDERPTLIPFLMAGYPNMNCTESVADALIREGVSILEIGIPFSDPLADGPVIQNAAEVSLKNGTTLNDVFDLCRRLTAKHSHVRIVLFTYLNPLLAYGLAEYTSQAKQAGVAATLTVDLPPEEANEYLQHHQKAGLQTVFLASQTTSKDRLQLIEESSSAFLYYIARTGVTGEQAALSETLGNEVQKLRQSVSGPIAIGFGISQPEHVKTVGQLAEGVVIGSAILRMIGDAPTTAAAVEIVAAFARSCLRAMDVQKS
jgi:tryptophan synthase alpha chain